MGVEGEPIDGARRASRRPGFRRAVFAPGHDAGVLELCDCARRLHRRARVRHVIRRLHRPAHLRAARHEAGDVPSAACPSSLKPHMSKGYAVASQPSQAVRNRRAGAGRQSVRVGRGHGALHDRSPAERRVRRRSASCSRRPPSRCMAPRSPCCRACIACCSASMSRTTTVAGSSDMAATRSGSTAICICFSTTTSACSFR